MQPAGSSDADQSSVTTSLFLYCFSDNRTKQISVLFLGKWSWYWQAENSRTRQQGTVFILYFDQLKKWMLTIYRWLIRLHVSLWLMKSAVIKEPIRKLPTAFQDINALIYCKSCHNELVNWQLLRYKIVWNLSGKKTSDTDSCSSYPTFLYLKSLQIQFCCFLSSSWTLWSLIGNSEIFCDGFT